MRYSTAASKAAPISAVTYSIADIAAFPWVRVAKGQGIEIERYPHVKRWCGSIAARPAATKRLDRDAATKAAAKTKYYDDETWKILFVWQVSGNIAGRCLKARL